MKDSMSQYSGIAASYKSLPLIALRELESVLRVEIYERECGFNMHKNGYENEGESEVSVGAADGANVAVRVRNCTKNNVLIGNFKGSKV